MSPTRPRLPAAEKTAAPSGSDLVTSHRWAWYGLSFFIPLCGLLLGLFLYDEDSREIRRVGRNALFIGFLTWVVFPLAILTALALLGLAGLAALLGQALSGMNG